MTTQTQSAVRYGIDADGIATLLLDDPAGSANTMNEAFKAGFGEAVGQLEADVATGTAKGAIVASAKKTFFAGGNLNALLAVGPADAQAVYEDSMELKAALRRLETCGVPVVAAINGAALGGGYEICLATHHRIAVDDPKVQVGLPEVTLGLLPGAGGVVRTVRKLGIFAALMDVLTTGTRFKAAAAKEKGLVDELVATQDELLPAAKAWLAANAGNPDAAVQPWDQPGYKMPGGTPSHPSVAQMLPAIPGNVRKQAKGVAYPAPRAIVAAAVEGAQVDFAGAEKIEGRYFTSLATGRVAKAMIQAFFFDLQRLNGDALRPAGVEVRRAEKLAVLGAGMMGAGIAYSSAVAGIEVLLKDISVEAAERGKAYSEKVLAKQVLRGKLTEEKAQQILARITPTADVADLAGCDFVIEAVFEDPALKQKLFAEVEGVVAPDALLGSNTSTLPITQLATGVQRQADFIGVHFFSPVDKMPIVEIIRGEQTSDEALARTIDYVQQIRKIPIVVNDSRGFYTSRIIGTRMNEGLAMLVEGVAPWSLERATTQAGYPAPTLQLTDELNMELMGKIAKATREAAAEEGAPYIEHPGLAVVEKMLEAGRPARVRGKGFYEYDEAGKRLSLWSGLTELFPVAQEQIPFRDVMDRMVFAEALETAKCFEEGVIDSSSAANIGAIMALGFPAISGGTVTFMTNHEGGLAGFVARANELADAYGERLRPSAWLVEKAKNGEGFPA
ncbi:3-hydroxyacyl-CoA dehydrogenase [Nocardioides phosphati]|uniref:3-hydroxyacyl-CoA dehydrogenase n=1 Tax=Nocardioides phosphati TaxID=1867775 RepID=A0ABQ2NEW3_9ACTN|nr:3-hydroxyacyl-CoA dehydrogenase NAD-binding domain-containing protein [Nocardioides phosphati]GGO93949.1 3-hydroxyacyl-CoA dehydrogenase [Nocardioides phosphati]